MGLAGFPWCLSGCSLGVGPHAPTFEKGEVNRGREVLKGRVFCCRTTTPQGGFLGSVGQVWARLGPVHVTRSEPQIGGIGEGMDPIVIPRVLFARAKPPFGGFHISKWPKRTSGRGFCPPAARLATLGVFGPHIPTTNWSKVFSSSKLIPDRLGVLTGVVLSPL